MLGLAMKHDFIEVVQVIVQEVPRFERARAHRRNVKQFYEGNKVCVMRLKPYTSEALVVAPAVAAVLGQEERMVDTGSAPEGDAVFVVLKEGRKDWAALDVGSVVGVKAHEEELSLCRIGPLVRLASKQLG